MVYITPENAHVWGGESEHHDQSLRWYLYYRRLSGDGGCSIILCAPSPLYPCATSLDFRFSHVPARFSSSGNRLSNSRDAWGTSCIGVGKKVPLFVKMASTNFREFINAWFSFLPTRFLGAVSPATVENFSSSSSWNVSSLLCLDGVDLLSSIRVFGVGLGASSLIWFI